MQCQAKEIADTLGHSTFGASSGWLNKFGIRYNISFIEISGKEPYVIAKVVVAFWKKCPSLLSGYSPRDVYNADETGLYFRGLSNKRFTLKKKYIGGKLHKQRLTILHCANMAGDKEKLLVIGKAAKHRLFNNIKKDSLPVFGNLIKNLG